MLQHRVWTTVYVATAGAFTFIDTCSYDIDWSNILQLRMTSLENIQCLEYSTKAD